MFGEKELKRWNRQDEQPALRRRTGRDAGVGLEGTFLIQSSHSSLAFFRVFFSVGLMRERDHCCFLSRRHDQSVSRLIKSTSISECDESAEPFILLLAYMALPLPLSSAVSLL